MYNPLEKPIMSRAVAVWLVQNTSLTFKQIGDFCKMHELEIKAIANGEVSKNVIGMSPINLGQLSKQEIERCSEDQNAVLLGSNNVYLRIAGSVNKTKSSSKRNSKYLPIAHRRNKPSAILWMLKNYPNLPVAQIAKLVKSTSATVKAILDRTHWNVKNIEAADPVLLGICSQVEIDAVLIKYNHTRNEDIIEQDISN